MQIKHAVYAQGAVKKEQYPSVILPEIALWGRSNVGKSSLVNCLLNRKNLARTSSQPGKTQLINFYLCDQSWYFVDLPGYGYAKIAVEERLRWQKMIEEYLSLERGRRQIWQLIDIRHMPSALDIQNFHHLQKKGLEPLVIATKADKISRGAREKQLQVIGKALSCKKENIICFSASEKLGKEILLEKIASFLKQEEV